MPPAPIAFEIIPGSKPFGQDRFLVRDHRPGQGMQGGLDGLVGERNVALRRTGLYDRFQDRWMASRAWVGPPGGSTPVMLTGGLPRGSGRGEVSDSVEEGDPLRSPSDPSQRVHAPRQDAVPLRQFHHALPDPKSRKPCFAHVDQSLRHTRFFSRLGVGRAKGFARIED